MVAIALKAEGAGLDVFATGEHHDPPLVPSSPTTMLGYLAARTERLLLSTATTLIATNDPVKIAEDYAMLRRLWTEDVVDWSGRFRTPLQGFTSTPRPLDGVPPFVWHGSVRSPQIAEQAAYYSDGFFSNHIFWPLAVARGRFALGPVSGGTGPPRSPLPLVLHGVRHFGDG